MSIMAVQPSQTTREFCVRLGRILRSSGANVEHSDVGMLMPVAGTTLHKGMSVTSSPPEQKENIAKLANALHAAKVIGLLPLYPFKDKKINIVVNRSADTPNEAKQY